MKKIILGLIMGVMAFSASAMECQGEVLYRDTGDTYTPGKAHIEADDNVTQLLARCTSTTNWYRMYSSVIHTSIWAAQNMSLQIRNAGFDTRVPLGYECWSACTDMFLGGNERIVEQDISQSGILAYHAASLPDEVLEEMYGKGYTPTWSNSWY